jgi:hypothetical protein
MPPLLYSTSPTSRLAAHAAFTDYASAEESAPATTTTLPLQMRAKRFRQVVEVVIGPTTHGSPLNPTRKQCRHFSAGVNPHQHRSHHVRVKWLGLRQRRRHKIPAAKHRIMLSGHVAHLPASGVAPRGLAGLAQDGGVRPASCAELMARRRATRTRAGSCSGLIIASTASAVRA